MQNDGDGDTMALSYVEEIQYSIYLIYDSYLFTTASMMRINPVAEWDLLASTIIPTVLDPPYTSPTVRLPHL